MAGHSKFKNIQHRKGAQDSKRAKVFTKLIREIITAVRTGQPDPAFNSRLRGAVVAARVLNLPKDKIENAIKRGSSASDGDNYDEMRYEGYAPGGIALIVEALTDNRNRTASDVRAAFTKYGGTLGETGGVSFMFDRVGLIEYKSEVAELDQVLEVAIEAGAEDVQASDECYSVYCDPELFHEVREALSHVFGDAEVARLEFRPQNTIEITKLEQAVKLLKLIEVLEDNDDVQLVFGNYEIADEIADQL
jgi:YebC/PmpR family DNA-binding regulatory protein